MPNRNYEKGRRAEWKSLARLRADGWYAVRVAGSKSLADIVAYHLLSRKTLWIQVKTASRIPADWRAWSVVKHTQEAIKTAGLDGLRWRLHVWLPRAKSPWTFPLFEIPPRDTEEAYFHRG